MGSQNRVHTRLIAASDKVYQLLAHGRWFSLGTSASSTTKTGRHENSWNIAESDIKNNKSNQMMLCFILLDAVQDKSL